MTAQEHPHPWLIDTLHLIESRPRSITYADLAQIAGRSEIWLKKVISGSIKNPPVNQIGKIHDFLQNQKSQ